jgi:hypothetical protein
VNLRASPAHLREACRSDATLDQARTKRDGLAVFMQLSWRSCSCLKKSGVRLEVTVEVEDAGDGGLESRISASWWCMSGGGVGVGGGRGW